VVYKIFKQYVEKKFYVWTNVKKSWNAVINAKPNAILESVQMKIEFKDVEEYVIKFDRIVSIYV
jgi:hypothetical protein